MSITDFPVRNYSKDEANKVFTLIKEFLNQNDFELSEFFSIEKDNEILVPIDIFKRKVKKYFGSKISNQEINSFKSYFNFIKDDLLDLKEFSKYLVDYQGNKPAKSNSIRSFSTKKAFEEEKVESSEKNENNEKNLEKNCFKINKIYRLFVFTFNEFLYMKELNNDEMKITNRINFWLDNDVGLDTRFKFFIDKLKNSLGKKRQKIFFLQMFSGLINSKVFNLIQLGKITKLD